MFLAEVVRVSVWIVGLAFVIGDHWFGFLSKKSKISRIWVGWVLLICKKNFMIEEFGLEVFKCDSSLPGQEIERWNEANLGGVQTTYYVGDEIIIIYRLSHSPELVCLAFGLSEEFSAGFWTLLQGLQLLLQIRNYGPRVASKTCC
jgi:hypothetical protein